MTTMYKTPLTTLPLLLALMASPLNPVQAQTPPAPSFEDQTTLPKDASLAPIQALLAAINAHKPEAVRDFLEKYTTPEFQKAAPMEDHLDFVNSLWQQTTGLDWYALRTYPGQPATPNKRVLILKDRLYGGWHAINLELTDDAKALIKDIRLNRARPPQGQNHPLANQQAMLDQAKKMVQKGCDKNVFSGSAMIAQGDKVILSMACGEASKRYHVKNNIDTKFNLGSMNKMFTAVSIAQLAEQGKLTYEDKISKYIDDTWLPKEMTDQITIHHLLSHTSGLGSYFNETYQKSSRDLFREVDDYKPLVKGDKLKFPPGSNYAYSNTGMLLLGVVIEKASAQNYFEYVRKNIYQPAGMKNSDSYPLDEPVENLAMGYFPKVGGNTPWRENTFLHVLRGGPAGGGYATSPDLLRFAQALQAGKLVKPATLATLWQDHSKRGYGYGFNIRPAPTGRVIGHSGGFPGLNSQLDMLVDQGFTVAVMSNHDSAASPLADQLGLLINRLPKAAPAK
jgi:CubicO group peptidase (beta-lactamase class C family)